MKAEVKWAQVWIAGDLTGNPWAWDGPVTFNPYSNYTVGDATVLVYPQKLLDQNGFIAVTFLNEIEKSEGRVYGLYGPPKDFGLLRAHLVAPVSAALVADLKINDWGVLRWLDRTIKNQTT